MEANTTTYWKIFFTGDTDTIKVETKSPSKVEFQCETLSKDFRHVIFQGEERSLLISCQVKFRLGLLIHHPAIHLNAHINLIDFVGRVLQDSTKV